MEEKLTMKWIHKNKNLRPNRNSSIWKDDWTLLWLLLRDWIFNTFVCLSFPHYLGGFDEKIAKRCQGVAFIVAPWESDNFTPPTSVLAILFISPCFVILHSLRTPPRKVLTTWHFYFSIIHNICNQNVCRLCDALWRMRGRSKKKTKRQSLQRY